MSPWKTSIEILAYPSITPFLDIPKACLSATPGAELQSLRLAGEKTMEIDRSRSVSSRQCLPWQHHHRGRTTMKKQGRRREIGKQKHMYIRLYTYIHVYIHTYIYIYPELLSSRLSGTFAKCLFPTAFLQSTFKTGWLIMPPFPVHH